jgi:hypothetical protein
MRITIIETPNEESSQEFCSEFPYVVELRKSTIECSDYIIEISEK